MKYIQLPLRFMLGSVGERREGDDPTAIAEWEERSKACWSVMRGLKSLSDKFGLQRESEPAFCLSSDSPSARAAERVGGFPLAWKRRDRRLTHETYGWTNSLRSHEHHIFLEVRDGGGAWKALSPESLYHSAVHEFGHRLQLEGLVDWSYDAEGGKRCSAEARAFADVVAKRSGGGYIRLHPNLPERQAREPDYEPLALQCRRKAGLSDHPSFSELADGFMIRRV
jgi:hypothetical protein